MIAKIMITVWLILELISPIFASEIANDAELEACGHYYYSMEVDGIWYSGSQETAQSSFSQLLTQYKAIRNDKQIDSEVKSAKLRTIREMMQKLGPIRCMCKQKID